MSHRIKCKFGYSILLFLFLFGCNAKIKNYTAEGKYISCCENKLKYLIRYFKNGMQKFYYSTGKELEIMKDSTFKLTTCGNIINGNWRIKSDTLILQQLSNCYRSESLRMEHPSLKLGIEKYVIKENVLFLTSAIKINGKTYLGVTLLKKI